MPDGDSLTTSLIDARFGASYWTSIARVGLEVANTLDYVRQRGTLSCDIEPANLILDS